LHHGEKVISSRPRKAWASEALRGPFRQNRAAAETSLPALDRAAPDPEPSIKSTRFNDQKKMSHGIKALNLRTTYHLVCVAWR
jgi:hypothetical protein